MRRQILLLSELQELELIIEESSILHQRNSSEKHDELKNKIAGIRKIIEPDLLERYDRMRQRGPAIVNESGGICTGCRLNVPRGDIQRMNNGSIPWICPNCSKFLLLGK